jgi:hypothetical protein
MPGADLVVLRENHAAVRAKTDVGCIRHAMHAARAALNRVKVHGITRVGQTEAPTDAMAALTPP